MSDDESKTNDGATGSIYDFTTQLRGLTERLMGLTGLTGLTEALPSIPTLPSLPRPAALSAAQLEAMRSTVSAQRHSIEALQAQLHSFDEQLSVLERILEPLTQWITSLADLEKTMLNPYKRADG